MNIDHASLKYICLAPISDFEGLGKVTRHVVKGRTLTYYSKGTNITEVLPDKNERLIFIDNGAKVLAVAHLDSVLDVDHYFVRKVGTKKGEGGRFYIFNCQLDDRLGAWLILEHLPKIIGDKQYDILLTEGEESGNSTARFFEPPRQYHWMFMFDRATQWGGKVDAVTYQYTSPETTALVKKYGWDHASGSYSCIRELEHLGCKGFNFGTGYADNHTLLSHAVIDEIQFSVGNFKRFFEEQRDVAMPHTKAPVVQTRWEYDYPEWERVGGVWTKVPKGQGKDLWCGRCGSPIESKKQLIDVITGSNKRSKRCIHCLNLLDTDIENAQWDGQQVYY